MSRADQILEVMQAHFQRWPSNVEHLAKTFDDHLLLASNPSLARTDLDALLAACLNAEVWDALQRMYSELNFHDDDEFGMCAATCRHPSHRSSP